MPFPQTRFRRLRATRALRGLVRETRLAPADFIYPMFVAHGVDRREPIAAMPGIDRLSIGHAVAEAGEALALGIPAVLLFGIPATKDERGSGAWDDEGIVQLATRAIKDAHPELLVVADLCLCEYTDHGHCGVIRQLDDSRAAGFSEAAGSRGGRPIEPASRMTRRPPDQASQPDDAAAARSGEPGRRAGGYAAGERAATPRASGRPGRGRAGAERESVVDNDTTLELLARTAVSQARAGADIIAPSDMMDGRVGAIRTALDDEGLSETPIMAYSAKFASAFYGPFRAAADSAPAFGDRRGYQLDPANGQEAVREARLDVEEGADILMVKPALPYLDVIRRIKDDTGMPLAAYNVSGEYSMLNAAVAAGYLDERAAVLESLTSIRRAGADIVITYHAKEAARWLQ